MDGYQTTANHQFLIKLYKRTRQHFKKESQEPSANTDPGPARGLKVFTDDPQNGHSQSSGRSLKAVPGGVFVLGSSLSGS